MQRDAAIVRARPEHCISRRDIDPDALKVLYRLARHHHTAYLVGGGVRDLLLQRTPKDFDVSTSAHPREIKKLFRNCFLIGRRFRLAHIKYGDKIIETSTFRALPKHESDPNDPKADLFQRDDNQFGTPAEDAARRDFTINGLFYDIETFSVLDYVGGLADLEKRVIRCIGDPDVRFREDPVRMIRAVRFASRLGFDIEPETLDAIKRHHEEIGKASPPRMLEEIYRLFGFRSGEAAFRLLWSTKLLQVIFPELETYLEESGGENAPLWNYLAALDTGDTLTGESTPALMFGSLLYDAFARKLQDEYLDSDRAIHTKQIQDFLQPIAQRLIIPKRVRDRLIRMFIAQQRFLAKRKRRFSKQRFVAQESFPEALSLCELHVTAQKGDLRTLQSWRDLYEQHIESTEANSEGTNKTEAPTRSTRRRRRRRPARKPESARSEESVTPTADTTAAPTTATTETSKDESATTEDTEKKRRRRRRRPARKPESAPSEEGQTPTPTTVAEETPNDESAETDGTTKKRRRKRRPQRKRTAADTNTESAATTEPVNTSDTSAPLTPEAMYRESGAATEKKTVTKPQHTKPVTAKPTPKAKQPDAPPRVSEPEPQAPHWLDEI